MASDAQVEEKTAVQSIDEWKEQIRKEIRNEERNQARDLLLIWQSKDLAELEKKMDVQVQEGTQKLFDKWVKDQAPPTQEHLQKLVSQDYVSFKVVIEALEPGAPEDAELKRMEFTIREVPEAIEEEFYRVFKQGLLENLPKLNAFNQKTLDMPFDQKIKTMMEAMEGGMEMMSGLTAMVLDPRKRKKIDGAWVKDNISSHRQWNIIQAQLEANRLRDFFSQVSQSGQTIQTMTQPLSYRSLLERLASSSS